jgi:ribosome-binding factor A
MGQRTIRLNKIVRNELSALLHTAFRDCSDRISITDAIVSPDFHDAFVYFSVVGDAGDIAAAKKFLGKKSGLLRRRLFQRIRLKYSPRLEFRYDDSMARGQSTLGILDELDGSHGDR